ncbi:hypothetical protein B7P43_G14544, partial [Cryptotermes secundus]
IKFLVKLGKSGSEIKEMPVQVYRDNAMKKTAVYKWVTRFSEERESVTDREFLASKQITVLEHLPYSQNLAPNDFFLFPKIREILKGRYFDDIDDIKSNVTAALKAIPQNQYQNCFEGWTRCWQWCIASQREYFEGNLSDIHQWGMQHFHHCEFTNFIVRPHIHTINLLEMPNSWSTERFVKDN